MRCWKTALKSSTTPRTKNLEQPDYVIDILGRKGDQWYLSRKIIFDRTTLVPHQQLIYDTAGEIATEATYQVYQDYNGVDFRVSSRSTGRRRSTPFG